MKKIIALLLVFVFLFTAVSCDFNPEPQETTAHVHEFVLSEEESKAVTCTVDGLEVKVCSCGERQETPIEATGHNMVLAAEGKPSCTDSATYSVYFSCPGIK